MRAVAVIERALLGLLQDAEESRRKDLTRSAGEGGKAVEAVVEIVSGNDLAFRVLRY